MRHFYHFLQWALRMAAESAAEITIKFDFAGRILRALQPNRGRIPFRSCQKLALLGRTAWFELHLLLEC
jgi:hypothetical protein